MWQKPYRQRGNWCSRIGLGAIIGIVLILLSASNRSVDLSYHNQVLAAVNSLNSSNSPDSPSYSQEAKMQAELERLAREDALGLLKLALKNYQNAVRDYVCTFIKQERIDGHLNEEEKIRVCFKEAPFSVMMSWCEPKGLVDKVLYVDKDNNSIMLVRPTGLAGMLVNTVRRDVHDPKVKKITLRTPAQFGFGRSLQDIIAVCEQAQQNGDLTTDYLGIKKMDGRDCLVLVRKLPMDKGYPSAKLVVYLDKEYLLPTRVESYDAAGNRFSLYMYLDVRFNLGLTDELFSPQANGMDG